VRFLLFCFLFSLSPRHVVGVINNFDDDTHGEFNDLSSFDVFREQFKKIREEERKHFLHFSSSLSFEHHCTAKAVFYAMDRIFHANFSASIASGLTNIRRTIVDFEEMMRQQSAPAPDCYHLYPFSSSVVSSSSSSSSSSTAATAPANASPSNPPIVSSYEGLDINWIYSDFYDHLVPIIQEVFRKFIERKVASSSSSSSFSFTSSLIGGEKHTSSIQEYGVKVPICDEEVWSTKSKYSATTSFPIHHLLLFNQKKDFYEQDIHNYCQELCDFFLSYCYDAISSSIFQQQNSSSSSATSSSSPSSPSSSSSLFHRIDRFPFLISLIKKSFFEGFKGNGRGRRDQMIKEKVLEYLRNVWNNEEPKGDLGVTRLTQLLNQEIPHILFTNTFYEIIQCWKEVHISWNIGKYLLFCSFRSFSHCCYFSSSLSLSFFYISFSLLLILSLLSSALSFVLCFLLVRPCLSWLLVIP
jgi:hypothetical protein